MTIYTLTDSHTRRLLRDLSRFLDVNPDNVAGITIEPHKITAHVYRLDGNGWRYTDPDGHIAVEHRAYTADPVPTPEQQP